MSTKTAKNRSESSDSVTGGRTPLLTDQELDQCVKALAQDLARMPKLDEIVEAAGGCQRKRAVEARRRLAESLSTQAIDDWTDLPPSIVSRHKRLLREWLALAREQITPWVDDVVAQSLDANAQLELRIAEQSAIIERNEQTIANLEAQLVEMQGRLDKAAKELAQSRQEAAIWAAIADERRAATNTAAKP